MQKSQNFVLNQLQNCPFLHNHADTPMTDSNMTTSATTESYQIALECRSYKCFENVKAGKQMQCLYSHLQLQWSLTRYMMIKGTFLCCLLIYFQLTNFEDQALFQRARSGVAKEETEVVAQDLNYLKTPATATHSHHSKFMAWTMGNSNMVSNILCVCALTHAHVCMFTRKGLVNVWLGVQGNMQKICIKKENMRLGGYICVHTCMCVFVCVRERLCVTVCVFSVLLCI